MSARSPIPVTITEPSEIAFFDDLYRRRVAAVSRLASTASTSEIATAFNSLITAMQTSAAMEST